MSRAAQILRAMADRIDRQSENEFAGCLVVIPPMPMAMAGPATEATETIEEMRVDPKADPVYFWAQVKARIDVKSAAVQESMRDPYSARR